MSNDRKHILYVACLCSSVVEGGLMNNSPEIVGLQAQKYHRLIARGLAMNDADVTVLCYHLGIEQIGIANGCEEVEERVLYHYIVPNLHSKLRYIQVLREVSSYVKFFLMKYSDGVVLCDVLNFTLSMAAVFAVQKRRRKIVGIITDFPEMLTGGQNLTSRISWYVINKCSAYVVLTQQMRDRLPIGKEAIVIEGQVDINMSDEKNSLDDKYEKKVCLYAGLLHQKYGVKTLVKAFMQLEMDDVELHLYGDGDCVEFIQNCHDERIKYFGKRPNREIVEAEKRATLLINPRPSSEEFTKYSFPSKNLEYMVSGTPILTSKLPGMPQEYYPYIYMFDEEDVNSMTSKLSDILNRNQEELHKQGERAKEFVIREKNNVAQTKKILEYI